MKLWYTNIILLVAVAGGLFFKTSSRAESFVSQYKKNTNDLATNFT